MTAEQDAADETAKLKPGNEEESVLLLVRREATSRTEDIVNTALREVSVQ